MRKPLSRICVVCCLIVLTASPLFASFKSYAPTYRDDAPNRSSFRLNWDWGFLEFLDLPVPLPGAIVNIFNDGPDPVESSEKETEEISEDESRQSTSNSGTHQFDSGGPGISARQRG